MSEKQDPCQTFHSHKIRKNIENKITNHLEKYPKQITGQLGLFFFTSPFGLQDNHMVRLFREAGAIIVGTTAMTEFGVTPLGCRGSTMGSTPQGENEDGLR
jgi:hypothetical protein